MAIIRPDLGQPGLPESLTGATSATRYVGGTASGAPVAGTFAVGDFVVAQNGHVFVCTVAGTPGTWVDGGSVGNLVTSVFTRTGAVVAGNADYLAVATGGLTGATGATRFVGATTTGIPTSGTFAVGDFVLGRAEGRAYVCTTAGTPGTWLDAAANPLIADLGFLGWNFDPYICSAGAVAATQTVYALAVHTIAGVTYNGLKLVVNTAGTSTAPAGFFVGFGSYAAIGSAGTMLAQSNDLHASANLTTLGQGSYAFNATYTETATGVRMALILMNGAFAGTNVQFLKSSAATNFGAVGSTNAIQATAGTGVTAFNSNGQAISSNYAAASTQPFWAGLY